MRSARSTVARRWAMMSVVRPTASFSSATCTARSLSASSAVQDALDRLMAGRTTLVIAHRPATIALADRVAVVDGGRITEEGTHTELVASSPRYRELLALAEAAAA